MEKKISVTLNRAYGNNYYYPKCPFSELLCKIIGKKTLLPRVIELLKKDGFLIEVVHDGR